MDAENLYSIPRVFFPAQHKLKGVKYHQYRVGCIHMITNDEIFHQKISYLFINLYKQQNGIRLAVYCFCCTISKRHKLCSCSYKHSGELQRMRIWNCTDHHTPHNTTAPSDDESHHTIAVAPVVVVVIVIKKPHFLPFTFFSIMINFVFVLHTHRLQ